jgi:ribonuclease PH
MLRFSFIVCIFGCSFFLFQKHKMLVELQEATQSYDEARVHIMMTKNIEVIEV